MENFCGQREKACANEEFLYVKGQLLRAVRKLSVNRKLLVCENGNFLRTAKKGMCKRKVFVSKKGGFCGQ